MMIRKALFTSFLCCSTPLTLSQSAIAAGPFALSAAQMDAITAAQAPAPTAAAAALADAIGQFAESGTYVGAWITENRPAGLPPSATTYLTVTTASGNAVATGPGSQSSVSTSTVNEQPFPDDSTISTTVQHASTILGTTIAFESEMKMGGYPIYFFNNPRALFNW